jgi:hypothetical protein
MHITFSSPERSYINYTPMPSPVYHFVINLVVSIPLRRGPGVFMNVSMWEHHALNNKIFEVAKFTVLKSVSYYPDVDSHSVLSV